MSQAGFQANPLWELTKARLREFVRERGTLFWVFGFPVLMAIGLGIAFRNKPLDLPRVAVVSDSDSAGVRALVSSSKVRAERAERAAADRMLARSKVDLIVEWQAGQPVFRFDPTVDRAPLARAVALDILEREAGRRDLLSVPAQTVTQPGGRYIDFLLPGLIGMNLMGSSMWGVGYSLVDSRKRKLLRRYAVTPMRRSQFLISLFFSRSFLMIVELGLLTLFGVLAFGAVPRGGILSLVSMAYLGTASFAAISLMIGARVANTDTANGWINLVQLPMWLLSGAFFSYERFPDWLHEPIRWLPLTALNDGLRGVYNDGANLLQLPHEVAVLALWGVVGFLVAVRNFRWQ